MSTLDHYHLTDLSRQQRVKFSPNSINTMGRPPGSVGRTQLKPMELYRVQVLYQDAKMGPTEIQRITGYSIYQIKYAIKKKTPTIGKRTGRPPKDAASSSSAQKESESMDNEDMDAEGMDGDESQESVSQPCDLV